MASTGVSGRFIMKTLPIIAATVHIISSTEANQTAFPILILVSATAFRM